MNYRKKTKSLLIVVVDIIHILCKARDSLVGKRLYFALFINVYLIFVECSKINLTI
jgi:hypothetical protein